MPVFGHDIRDTIGTNGEAGTSIDSYVLDTAATSNTKGAVATHEVSNSKFTSGTTYSLVLLVMLGDDYVISGAANYTAYTSGVMNLRENPLVQLRATHLSPLGVRSPAAAAARAAVRLSRPRVCCSSWALASSVSAASARNPSTGGTDDG